MSRIRHSAKLLLVMACLLVGWAPISQGLIVTLSAFTTYALTGPSGAPLAEGSVVMIIGSLDSTPDPMAEWGGALIADSTTGDDIFIGVAYVLDDGTISAGGFKYDSSMVNYLYLRFFDTTSYPIWSGTNAWGTTDVWGVTNQFQFVSLDFAPDHPYGVGHTNLFVIIPEAGTGNYMLMALLLGAGWGLYGAKKGRHAKVRIRSR